jgi:raffinose/stachyose/melibiose transport system substrate-binding protein
MKSTRWLALTAMAVTALAGLTAACSGGVASTSGGGGTQTIRLASVSTERPGLEADIKAFQKQNPGVKFVTSYADTDQYQATLRTQLSSGTAPDVFFAWPGNGNSGAIQVLAPAGYLADLSARPWVAKIPAGIKPVTVVNGKTYIVPETFVGIGAIYNKSALAQVGVQPPATWNQLLAFCAAAKAKGKVAFALGNQTNWVTQLVDYSLVPTTVYATDKNFDEQMKAGTASFAKSGWLTAMDKYLEMNKRGCFSKDPLGTSVDDSIAQVASGKAVAVIQVTAELGQLKQQAPQGTQFGMFPVPATDNASQTEMPGAAGGAYAENAKAKNRALATKFIDFLATPTAMNLYANATGNLPAVPNAQFTVDPVLQPLVDYQKAGKTVPFMDQLWPNPVVQQVHFTGVANMFSGKATPEQVLKQMDQAYHKQ